MGMIEKAETENEELKRKKEVSFFYLHFYHSLNSNLF
jgi:hypothetical protein